MKLALLGVLVTISLYAQTSIRVNVGGSQYTDSAGNVWSADTGCSGATTFNRNNNISGTSDPTLYRTGRQDPSNISCTFAVTNLTFYLVTLKFAITDPLITSNSSFIQNVAVNGLFSQVDFVRRCNGVNVTCDLTFGPLPVSTGSINIAVSQINNYAFLNAIDIEVSGGNVSGGTSLSQVGSHLAISAASTIAQEATVLWADQFPGGDIGAKVNAAVTACPTTGCQIMLPAGQFPITTPININKASVGLWGYSQDSTQLIVTGTFSGPVITVNPGALARTSLIDFRVDCSAMTSTNQIGISLQNVYDGRVGRVAVYGPPTVAGFTGIKLGAQVTQSRFLDIFLPNITLYGIDDEGENTGGENYFDTVTVTYTASTVSTAAGFLYNRTTAPDNGGTRLVDLTVTCGGQGGYGFEATSTAASTFAGFLISNSVFDGCNGNDAVFLHNVTNIQIANSWMVSSGGAAFAGFHIDASSIISVVGSYVGGVGYAVNFTGSDNAVVLSGNIFNNSGTVYHLDAVGSKTSIQVVANVVNNSTTLTNDLNQLSQAGQVTTIPSVMNGMVVVTNGNGSGASALTLEDGATGAVTPNKTIRNSGGNLQILNNAFSAAIATFGDSGFFNTPAYQTQSVPAYVYVCQSGGTGCGSTPGDFTTSGSGTALEAITGLAWTLPGATALNIPFTCHIIYHQNTATATVNFGVQDATTAPTQFNGKIQQYTSATAFTAANLVALASTTATGIGAGVTPSVITTNWNTDIEGFIEQPSGTASVFSIRVSTATAADTVVIKRGSFCTVGF